MGRHWMTLPMTLERMVAEVVAACLILQQQQKQQKLFTCITIYSYYDEDLVMVALRLLSIEGKIVCTLDALLNRKFPPERWGVCRSANTA